MGSEQKTAYEAPSVTYYGTLQELTMGNGTVMPLDAATPSCGALTGLPSSNTPSGVTCKFGA